MTFVNEAGWDRIFRLIIGVLFGYAAWIAWPTTTAMVYIAIAVIGFATAAAGWCPVYALFGFSTKTKAGA
jgi:hypothetical protein